MQNKVKRVAIINSVCTGSTGKISLCLYNYLKEEGIDSYVCYARGKGIDNVNCYKIGSSFNVFFHYLMSLILGGEGKYSWWATKKLVLFLKEKNIDTVFALLLHGYYLNQTIIFDYMAKHDIRFIYIMVDEYPLAGKCGCLNGCKRYEIGCGQCVQVKQYPKTLFFDRSRELYQWKGKNYAKLKRAVYVGPEFVINHAKNSPILRDKNLQILDEAVNLEVFYPRNCDKLKKELKIGENKIVIVCVTPYFGVNGAYERKGGIYFKQLAEKFESDDKYVFVHVGYCAKNESKSSNYITEGYIHDENRLAEYFSLGDLFVFPSTDDTMPNACLDALGCGTPLLCFNISGMPYIGDNTVLTLVEPRDVNALTKVVSTVTKKNETTINRCREYALKRYDSKLYSKRLVEIAEGL